MIKITRKFLLSSPVRDWSDTTPLYDCLFIVPTGKKHDSGFMQMAIVGINGYEDERQFQIAAYCDDINWHIPPKDNQYVANLRMDCEYPSGIIKAWYQRLKQRQKNFRVGESLSSTDVYVGIEDPGGNI